ncbi:hypothetical protein [Alishewanella longhuensis]
MSVDMQHLAINFIALTDNGEHQAHYRDDLIGNGPAIAALSRAVTFSL